MIFLLSCSIHKLGVYFIRVNPQKGIILHINHEFMRGLKMKKILQLLKSVLDAWSEARLAYLARRTKNYPIGS